MPSFSLYMYFSTNDLVSRIPTSRYDNSSYLFRISTSAFFFVLFILPAPLTSPFKNPSIISFATIPHIPVAAITYKKILCSKIVPNITISPFQIIFHVFSSDTPLRIQGGFIIVSVFLIFQVKSHDKCLPLFSFLVY